MLYIVVDQENKIQAIYNNADVIRLKKEVKDSVVELQQLVKSNSIQNDTNDGIREIEQKLEKNSWK
jgi:hypothetical protein